VVVKVCAPLNHPVVLRLRLVFGPALMLVTFKDPEADSAVDLTDTTPLVSIVHYNEQPALAIAGIWGLRCCFENPGYELSGNGIGFEPAHRPRRIHRFKQPNFRLVVVGVHHAREFALDCNFASCTRLPERRITSWVMILIDPPPFVATPCSICYFQ